MNDLVRFAQGVQTATGKKRGRHPVFNSRMFYPYKEELRLQVALKAEISRYIAEAYAVAVNGEAFSDDLETLANFGGDLPEDFRSEVSAIGRAIGRKVSESVARSSEMIVGKPYYPPNAKEEIYRTWEANFQTLCKSAESDAKKEISRIVSTAKNEGWNGRQLEKAIKGELEPKFRHRAELIARTESAKLNGSVTRATYREMGCRYYVWMATMDERTRPDHQEMNGVICSVDDPTVYYTENPDDPMHPVEHQRTSEMCHLHPGDDFQCRCTSVAWDPEIDGHYEVKERPEEEPSEEPEEKPENEPESRELEKANERLAEQEKELEKVENERKTVEKELSQEKNAKEAAEKAQKEAEATIKKEAEKSISAAEKGLESAKRYEGITNDPGLKKCVAEVEKSVLETKKSGIASALYEKLGALKERIFGIQSEEDVMEMVGAKRFGSKKSLLQSVNGANPTKSGSNCPACAAVYELRCRGWDVAAKEELKMVYHADPSLIYKNPQKIKFSSYSEAEKKMLASDEGSRFTICFTMLKNGVLKDHVISAFIENSKVVLVDPQMDDYKVVDYFRKYKLVGTDHFLFKVDNLKFKPSALKDLLE